MKKVNLGSGDTYLEGYVNIDNDNQYKVDLIHDINAKPLPFLCDEILANDILEHLSEQGFLNIISSLKVGGLLYGKSPHFACMGAYGDYQHQRYIGILTFHLTRSIKGKVTVKTWADYSIFGFVWTMPFWFVLAHEKMCPGIFPPIWVNFKIVKN